MLVNADYEEPNCMWCMNQVNCDGENCGPEEGWRRYHRVLDDEQEESKNG